MAIKISGNTVVDDDRRGTFHLVNAGAYNQQELDDLVIKGVEVGDAVYNKDREALSYWDGTQWVPKDNPCGEQVYLSAGTYNWIAPKDVTSVCVVCVGGGGAGGSKMYKVGGGGGGLGWRNNIPVTPGQSYKVVVGAGGVHRQGSGHGGDSYFLNTSTVLGGGGYSGNFGYNNGGRYVGQGGGNGGGTYSGWILAHGGNGAGGYTGKGGAAHTNQAGEPGEGGGGGAGQDAGVDWGMRGNGGGGVGIYGQGADGKGGGNVLWPPNDVPGGNNWRNYTGPNPGKGGSPAHGTGTDGTKGSIEKHEPWSGGNGNGGFPGGGGGQQEGGVSHDEEAEGTPGRGGGGAVRILWGEGRAFPSTRVGKNECGDGTPFRPPVLNSAGSIPTSSKGGVNITVTGASKTDGTLPSSLEFNWNRTYRSNGSSEDLGWGTSNSILTNTSYDKYWAEVRAIDTEGNTSTVKSTNICNVGGGGGDPVPPPQPKCGWGQSSEPKWPPRDQAIMRKNLKAGAVFDFSLGSWHRRYIQYTAFFTKNGSTLQVLVNGKWQNDRAEVVTHAQGGGGRVRLTQDDEVHAIAILIEHEQVDNTSGSSNNTGSMGRSLQQETSTLAAACKGNSSSIAFHAGCVFNTYGHYIWANPDQSGYATAGDNYIKAAVKFFGVNGHDATYVTFFTDDPNKMVAVGSKTVYQPRG